MYSDHATQRMNQRGINSNVVETIIDWGVSFVCHGADLYYLPKKAIKRLAKSRLLTQSPEKYVGIYVVVQDGEVKTVAHKINRRFAH
jgi:hypothetical protein